MTTTTTRILRLPAVIGATGLGRDTLYRLIREGRFPRPLKLTERSSGWKSDDIEQWIASRPVAQIGGRTKQADA